MSASATRSPGWEPGSSPANRQHLSLGGGVCPVRGGAFHLRRLRGLRQKPVRRSRLQQVRPALRDRRVLYRLLPGCLVLFRAVRRGCAGKRWASDAWAFASSRPTDSRSIPRPFFLRTLFRVIDQMPPLWIVLLLTQRGQRLGDLVAGTIVVANQRRGRRPSRTAVGATGRPAAIPFRRHGSQQGPAARRAGGREDFARTGPAFAQRATGAVGAVGAAALGPAGCRMSCGKRLLRLYRRFPGCRISPAVSQVGLTHCAIPPLQRRIHAIRKTCPGWQLLSSPKRQSSGFCLGRRGTSIRLNEIASTH